MSHLRNASYASQTAASKDRITARMVNTAEPLPDAVSRRDAKAVEALLGRRTKIELQAIAVILAYWLARAEAREAAREGRAA